MAEWSNELKRTTATILDERRHVPMRDFIPLKHIDGAYAVMALDEWLSDWPRTITDRQTGQTHRFADCDALIAAGWAVD